MPIANGNIKFEQAPAMISPKNILTQMAAAPTPNVYVLGCYDKRVTVISQQVRALNLIYALCECKGDRPSLKIAIMGGGFAGLTAAAAAVEKGCTVTLLESHAELLHLMRNNRTRWLHPYVYDWPYPGWDRPSAEIPLCSWEAGIAGAVSQKFLSDWLKAYASSVDVVKSAAQIGFKATPSGVRVSWPQPQYRSGEFDCLIIAVGFGIEKAAGEHGTVSYWHDDNLDNSVHISDEPLPRSFLVSGAGDGGLVDTLRLSIQDFRHDTCLRELIYSAPEEGTRVEKQLLDIEMRMVPSAPEEWLYQQYSSIECPEIDKQLQSRERKDTVVTLNSMSFAPFTVDSNILNRFLVSRLLRTRLKYIPGTIVVEPEAKRFKVSFDGKQGVYYNQVILRHGPSSSVKRITEVDGARSILEAYGRLDMTRVPQWPETYYEKTIISDDLSHIPSDASIEKERNKVSRRQSIETQGETATSSHALPLQLAGPPVTSRGSKGHLQKNLPITKRPFHIIVVSASDHEYLNLTRRLDVQFVRPDVDAHESSTSLRNTLYRSPSGDTILCVCLEISRTEVDGNLLLLEVLKRNTSPDIVLAIGLTTTANDDVNLGDIVISRDVVILNDAYFAPGGDLLVPSSVECREEILNSARGLNPSLWLKNLSELRPLQIDAKSSVHQGTFCALPRNQSDLTQVSRLMNDWPATVAIDADTTHILQLLSQLKKPPALVAIKAVVNRVASDNEERWRSYATEAISAFTSALIVKMIRKHPI